jgi:NitT/TauT family transport system substrate-binding protein
MLKRVSGILVLLCALTLSASAAAGKPEKADVVIAVGGISGMYYLPLALADRLGYFKDEGLNVEIADFAGGSKALQAMMGGSADVTAGGFDHVITLQSRGQNVQSFVLMLTVPAIELGVVTSKLGTYRSSKDLKGMKIGVTAPGSTTHMFVNRILKLADLAPDDVSIIGIGSGPTAVAAARAGQVDALANVEPVISMLEHSGAIKVVAESITEQGSKAIFGNKLPSGCLYTKQEFIQKYPNTVQALANAIVRALKWLQKSSVDDVAKAVPKEYLLGEPEVYRAALRKSLPTYSPDGAFSPAAVQAFFEVLGSFDPNVKAAAGLDIRRTYENKFVAPTP